MRNVLIILGMFGIPGLAIGAAISFETVVINPDAGVVPAVALSDIDGDEDLDIVAMGNDDIAWYENPGWERHLISPTIDSLNVCMALADLTGDGLPEMAAGADWQFGNTSGGGSLHILVRGDDVRQPWQRSFLLNEPTIHRIRWADTDGNGKPELFVAPLKGRGTTDPDFREAGVRLLQLTPPQNPLDTPWPMAVVTQDYHVMHNLYPVEMVSGRDGIITASFEGLTLLRNSGAEGWSARRLTEGCPLPWPQSGSSEVKVGRLGDGIPVIATIEPWHGHIAVIYLPDVKGPLETATTWRRHELDDTFNQGHAVGWADFNGDGRDELVAGYREPSPESGRVGLMLFQFGPLEPGAEPTFEKQAIDDGGMATEDMAIGDLNGDGKPDILAAGRSTHNLKIYLTR